MKLGKSVLLEIVAIVQEGIFSGADISGHLREIDVTVSGSSQDEVELSEAYTKKNRKA